MAFLFFLVANYDSDNSRSVLNAAFHPNVDRSQKCFQNLFGRIPSDIGKDGKEDLEFRFGSLQVERGQTTPPVQRAEQCGSRPNPPRPPCLSRDRLLYRPTRSRPTWSGYCIMYEFACFFHAPEYFASSLLHTAPAILLIIVFSNPARDRLGLFVRVHVAAP